MKKLLDYIVFILLFIWQLPQNIVALVMMPFMGKLRLVKYNNYNFCFEGEKMSGGISLGSFCYVSPWSADCEETVAHEQDGHVKQSHLLGPLYLIVIGIPSITWAWTHIWLGFHNYYCFYTESWANKLAGLKSVEKYPNYFVIEFITKKEP